MQHARLPIVQIDVVLCEDGRSWMAFGHTEDDDDTAYVGGSSEDEVVIKLVTLDALNRAPRDQS
jgi:hypothetical protein